MYCPATGRTTWWPRSAPSAGCSVPPGPWGCRGHGRPGRRMPQPPGPRGGPGGRAGCRGPHRRRRDACGHHRAGIRHDRGRPHPCLARGGAADDTAAVTSPARTPGRRRTTISPTWPPRWCHPRTPDRAARRRHPTPARRRRMARRAGAPVPGGTGGVGGRRGRRVKVATPVVTESLTTGVAPAS